MGVSHLIAIPVFNEVRYVPSVLAEVRRYTNNVLVIDDGSTDGTAHLLRDLQRDAEARGDHWLTVITHSRNLGYGRSVADAFDFAVRQSVEGSCDWLITMDCDEQHEPARIPDFLAAAEEDDADIISGTRYPRGWDAEEVAPWDRREINRRITLMIHERLGLPLTDAFCGFKAHRVSALRQLCITESGYAMPMQFWVQVARMGMRVRELPVELIYNDPTRHFGGLLDDPAVRLNHYIEVFEAERARAVTCQTRRCTPRQAHS